MNRGIKTELEPEWTIIAGDEYIGRTYLKHDCWRSSNENRLPSAGNDCGPGSLVARQRSDGLFYCHKCKTVASQHVSDVASLSVGYK